VVLKISPEVAQQWRVVMTVIETKGEFRYFFPILLK